MKIGLRKIDRKILFENITGFSFVLPLIIFIIIFLLYPIIASLVLSFFKWKGYGNISFVGVQNFIKMFTVNRHFSTAIKNSMIFSVVATSGTVIIGFLLAVVIDLKIFLWKFYRFIFFLTVIITVVVTGMLWLRIFDPYGLVNNLLIAMNLEGLQRPWMGEANVAFAIIIFVTIWQYSGFTMIFFLAGMQNIDENIYEAARIDGASTFRRVVSITIPLLKNVFAVVTMLQLIFSFKVFDIVWVMTGGGPAGGTEVLGTLLYKIAFRKSQFGSGSVIAIIMFLLAAVFAFIYIRTLGYQKMVKGK